MRRSVMVVLLAACGGGATPPNGNGTTPGPITQVAVTPKNFTVQAGASQQLTAVGKDAAGTVVVGTPAWNATWGSVSASGLFTAVGVAGNAKVWATMNAVTDTATGVVAAATAAVDTVFAENFESGTFTQWQDRGATANQTILNNAAEAHSGNRVLQLTYPASGDAGWLTRFFLPGYDTLWVGYWVKFETGWQTGTKLIAFYGSRTDDQWSATGKAGVCPNGTDFFALVLTADANLNPGPTRFYAYFPAMTRSGTSCFGDDGGASYVNPRDLTTGVWHYIEYEIAINTIGQSNTVQKYWVDGVLRGTWSGISVRTSTILKLNAFTISANLQSTHPLQHVWIDDILVAKVRPGGF